MGNLWKEYVNLFYSEVGRVSLPLCDLNKGTLLYSQAEGQDPLRQAIEYYYKQKSKK